MIARTPSILAQIINRNEIKRVASCCESHKELLAIIGSDPLSANSQPCEELDSITM